MGVTIPSVSVNGLTLKRGQSLVQTDLNFEAYPGDIIGIIGPNGVGKTTLLHSIAGLHSNTAGTIKVFGKAMQKISFKERAKYLSLQFQTFSLGLPLTVKEALEMAYYPHTNSLHQPKSKKVIQDYVRTFELGALSQRDILSLSGGEQQRVALAMCFIQSTPIALLDEPINHLDLKHQSQALRLFKQQAQEKKQCLILSCHNLQVAQKICTKVLLLSHSEKALFGAPQRLLSPKYLEPLFETQFVDIRQSTEALWSAHP